MSISYPLQKPGRNPTLGSISISGSDYSVQTGGSLSFYDSTAVTAIPMNHFCFSASSGAGTNYATVVRIGSTRGDGSAMWSLLEVGNRGGPCFSIRGDRKVAAGIQPYGAGHAKFEVYNEDDATEEPFKVFNDNGNYIAGFEVNGDGHGYLVVSEDDGSNIIRVQGNNQRVGLGMNAGVNYQLHLSDDSAGKPGGGDWTDSSDSRLKDNIVTASLDRCYDIVKNLPLKRYTWKDSTYTIKQSRDRSMLGWIAQDVQSVFPKAIGSGSFTTLVQSGSRMVRDTGSGSEVIDDCLNLNTTQIMRSLYGAVQKLQLKVEALEAQIS